MRGTGIAGEIAIPSMIVCDRLDDCGCDRSHVGLNSRCSSTTLKVHDIDLGFDDLVTACVGFLDGAGWLTTSATRKVEAHAGELVAGVAEVAADYAVGTVLRTRFDRDAKEWVYDEATV